MSDCKHGMEKEWCSICLHPEGSNAAERTDEMVIAAKHPGRCAAGSDLIDPGDDITPTDRGWAHPECVA